MQVNNQYVVQRMSEKNELSAKRRIPEDKGNRIQHKYGQKAEKT